MPEELTPELVVWATYAAGFLFSLGWSLAAAKHDEELKDFPPDIKLTGCLLVAFCWPALLAYQEDEEEEQDGPVS